MAQVDRTKHYFDLLEHVLRGIHTAPADAEHLIVHEGVPDPGSDREMPEVRVMIRGRLKDS